MDSPSAPLPASIGRFRIDSLLGRGGMGDVYKAFDPTLQRTVAVKTVRADLGGPDALARLYREAQACARLQHPHIVTVYEAGEIDRLVYIAMEYLKGRDLAQVVREGTLSFDEKLEILIQILTALDHAHSEGVIHRDIKPSNVFILPTGSVKLVDFGLARVLRADTLTMTGAVMGTPHYASPEQLSGAAIDHRTDIYSTGALAYELCTGRRPFEREDETLATLLMRVMSDEPPAMDVSWSRLYPELERIVRRSMAKSPDDRFQSADEMRQAIAAFRATNPTVPSLAPDAATEIILTRPSLPPTMTAGIGVIGPEEPTATALPAPRSSRKMLWLGAAAAVLVAAITVMRWPTSAAGATSTPPPPAASEPGGAVTTVAASGASTAGGPAVVPVSNPRPVAEADQGVSARDLFIGTTPTRGGASGAKETAAKTGLSYRLVQQTASGGEKNVDTSTTFHTGDAVRFVFESNTDGYLYIVMHGASGAWGVLFPDPKIKEGKNAIKKFEQYPVPGDQWFEFDKNAGTEEIFVFFSRDPLTKIPGFNDPKPEQIAMAVNDLKQQVQPRDLVLGKAPATATGRAAAGGVTAGPVNYVVNKDEVGKSVTVSISLVHAQ